MEIIKDSVISKKINIKSDLSICVEVAEHIHPNQSEFSIDNLVKTSEIIIFGAANTFQPGDAHINCRNTDYWINLFEKRGYTLIDIFRYKFWNDPLINKAYAQNTFLYIKNGSKYIDTFSSVPLLNIYHPELINPHYLNESRSKPILFNDID